MRSRSTATSTAPSTNDDAGPRRLSPARGVVLGDAGKGLDGDRVDAPGEGAEGLQVPAEDQLQIQRLRAIALGLEGEIDPAVGAAQMPGSERLARLEGEVGRSGGMRPPGPPDPALPPPLQEPGAAAGGC